MNNRLTLLTIMCCMLIFTHLVFADPSLQGQYEQAQQRYDIDLAQATYQRLQAEDIPRDLLYVKICLLLAEVHRYQYEDTDKGDAGTRRTLGAQIDEVATDGLSTLGALSESSEKYRLQADLIGTMIRTKFQARKLRHKMEEAIAQARRLDPQNPKALLSAAKPYLFGKDSEENIATALELINQSIDIAPESEHAWLMRGMAHEEMDKPEQARKDWEHALQINPYSLLAKTALQKQL